MFGLTHYERKILIIIGGLLLVGAILRLSNVNFFKERRIEVAYQNQPNHKVNINKASLDELISLPYIGEEIARRIMEYRKNQGEIKSLEELLQIKGIGEKRLNAIGEHISF